MPPASTFSNNNISARTTSYTVRAQDIVEVLCHRRLQGSEEYLVRWRTKPSFPRPPRAPLSWHVLHELWDALYHVQSYLDTLPTPTSASIPSNPASDVLSDLTASRKRKAPDIEPELSREVSRSGLLTPGPSTSDRSRSPSDSVLEQGTSASTVDGASDPNDLAALNDNDEEPRVYNLILQKKAGYITAKRVHKNDRVPTTHLPTPRMLRDAERTPHDQAEKMIRHKFMHMLRPVHGIFLENNVDHSTPSLNFTFIQDYVIRDGVAPVSEDFLQGCEKCKPDMGGHCGCEYTAVCGCLEFAAVDEDRLKTKDNETYSEYQQAQERGEYFDTMGLPKRFPYSKPNGNLPQKLGYFYLEQRHPIYECNSHCKCGPICKSRLVQKGRKVDLTIFKTRSRGWGVYCNEDLVRGEFIDTYLGEVVTSTEATERENKSGSEKNSYLYSLDKFVGDTNPLSGAPIESEDCHVVDGQYMGGPTRFINHSCEPNCRQYTVSYNKNDLFVYQLAFFAYEDIPAGRELTFDYMDRDELELEDAIKQRTAAQADPANKDKIPCNCGAPKCRGFLW